MNTRRLLARLLTTLLISPLAAMAQPSDYPNRPISWVVPFPAGNVTDAFARIVAQAMSTRLGQPVVVENRAGAAGIIGAQYVAGAKPDGYTMLYGSSSIMASHISLYKNLPFDPLQSFTPVNALAANPLILVVNPNKGYKTLEEFIAYLKKNPGTVSMGSPGVGTGAHLVGELFQIATGTKMVHVPYKEGSAMFADLRAGRIDAIFDFIPTMREHLKAGTLLALGITRDERVKSLPDLPTFKEKGFDVTLSSWSSIVVPAGTPPEITAKLSTAVQEAMKSPEVVRFQESNDQVPLSALGPDKLKDFVLKEQETYRTVVKRAGVTLD